MRIAYKSNFRTEVETKFRDLSSCGDNLTLLIPVRCSPKKRAIQQAIPISGWAEAIWEVVNRKTMAQSMAFKILVRQVANAMMLVLILAMVVSFAIKF